MKPWNLLRRRRPRSTDGTRVYAIGDVHGCLHLLVDLLQRIETDTSARERIDTHLVILGDFIDRGGQSADVCTLLHSLKDSGKFHCIKGNHEQAMVDVYEGSVPSLRFWLQYGGGDTLLSFGVDEALIERARVQEEAENQLIREVQQRVPAEIIAWMAELPTQIHVGDYLFVHAGIRPKVPLSMQSEFDLMWIREPFLSSKVRHPRLVVHGHSERDEPELLPNRFGIDTGAYRTGVLTAVGIENDDHWILQTGTNQSAYAALPSPTSPSFT